MQPMVASGEMFQSVLISNLIASGVPGLDRSAKEIGTSESDSAMEMIANSWKPSIPTDGIRYCASVTEPRSTNRYIESVRARLELVTRALSQLSTTANKPAKHSPWASRIENQNHGTIKSAIAIDATEAIAA